MAESLTFPFGSSENYLDKSRETTRSMIYQIGNLLDLVNKCGDMHGLHRSA